MTGMKIWEKPVLVPLEAPVAVNEVQEPAATQGGSSAVGTALAPDH